MTQAYNLSKILFAWWAILASAQLIDFNSCIGYEKFGIISKLIRYSLALIAAVILYSFIIMTAKRKYKMSSICTDIIVMYVYLAIISILQNNTEALYKRGFLSCICMSIVFDMVLVLEDLNMFKNFLRALNTLAIINFISIVLMHSSNGFLVQTARGIVDSYYFLSLDNGHIVMLFPVICFNYAIYLRTRKVRYLVIVLVSIVGELITFSVTSCIMIALIFTIYFVRTHISTIGKIFTNKLVVVVMLIIIFAFFFLGHGIDLLSNVFILLFKKDIASTGRAGLYPIALDYIRRSPIVGYGYVADNRWIGGFNSPHNVIMNYLLAGGIIGLFLFLRIIYKAIKMGNNGSSLCQENIFLLTGIIAYVIASLAEGYDTYESYYLFWWVCISLGNNNAMNRILDSYKRTDYRYR